MWQAPQVGRIFSSYRREDSDWSPDSQRTAFGQDPSGDGAAVWTTR